VLNRTDSKGLLTKLWKVPEERLNIILCLVRANRIHDIRLLVSLLLPEITNVIWLEEVGLIGGKLNYLDLIYLCFKDKVVSFVTRRTVDKKNMLGLIRSAIVILDKII
jgi:hypothetical protein